MVVVVGVVVVVVVVVIVVLIVEVVVVIEPSSGKCGMEMVLFTEKRRKLIKTLINVGCPTSK